MNARVGKQFNRKRVSFPLLCAIIFFLSETAIPALADTVVITGLATSYGPNQSVNYKISGISGDSCQLSYPNQTAKPFTMGSAGATTASFTTGNTPGLIVINVQCAKSGIANARSEIVVPASTSNTPKTQSPPPLTPTPSAPTPLPGEDASVNSTLSSIIEPQVNTCEEGDLTTARSDSLAFGQGDNVKATVFNANNAELSLALVTKSAVMGDKQIAVKIRICQADPSYIGASQDYRLVMTYADAPRYFVQTQEYKFRIISRTEVANFSQYAVSRVRTNCTFDQRAIQNVYVQSGTMRKPGEKMTIKGTLYRAGLIASNDTVKLVKITDLTSRKIIATTTTDAGGKYSFTFTLESYPKAIYYEINVPERKKELGPISGPFPEKKWPVFIDCDKGCTIKKYIVGDKAPVNTFTETCLESLSFYNLVLSQGDDENSRLLRKVVLYPIISSIVRSRSDVNASSVSGAAVASSTSPNSPSASNSSSSASDSSGSIGSNSSSSSSGGGGGRCYVSGYTTKKGTRVKGYYRSC